ncbi:hypothetical protein LDENG_00273370 [Lucifuga dentata]|nr:hypothetical protein LDENG_00273370 [Lucifuga dentata]
MQQTWLLLFAFLGGFLVPGVWRVDGISIYTVSELEAVNGTDVKLKCSFRSSHSVSLETVSVSWNFIPLGRGFEENVLYYYSRPYLPKQGHFKNHVLWSGDVMSQDASITLREVLPTFNGTYICKVLNIPDVHGKDGEVILRVVNKGTL